MAAKLEGLPGIVVNDAYRRVPGAPVLYACDASWWDYHQGAPDFQGEKWSSHGHEKHDNKMPQAEAYGLRLVKGCSGKNVGFSYDPDVINYGDNSGFQAVNLAIHFGARKIVLVGFDMHGTHFFGKHPSPLRNAEKYDGFIRQFDWAARHLPDRIEILNATPGSALRCFPMVELDDYLATLEA